MTVTSTANKIIYAGTGATDTFPYSFSIFAKTDLVITEVVIASGLEAELVVDSDYTVEVDVDGNFTGNVILLDGNLPATKKLVILRQLPLTQETDYTKHGPLPAETLESGFDRLTYITQQLQEQVDRSLKVSVASTEEPTSDELLEEIQAALTAAELAETHAETAETNAELAETNAETAETNAAASAVAAAASAATAADKVDEDFGLYTAKTTPVAADSVVINDSAAAGVPKEAAISDILKIIHPVGSIYMSVVSTNPNTLFGFGTWEAFGAGRVLVGLDAGQTEFDTVEETGGAKTHTLSIAETPAHTHTWYHPDDPAGSGSNTGSDALQQSVNRTTGSTGGGNAHNNLQPYVVVYMWKRTA